MAITGTQNTIASGGVGVEAPSFIGSLDNTRRLYNFGDRVAELAPEQTPWFVYLSKVAKQSTDDPTFKFMEQRHQWQRRNFYVQETIAEADYTSGTTSKTVNLSCKYDKYGNVTTADTAPEYLLGGQIITISDSAGVARQFRIATTVDNIDLETAAGAAQVDITALFTATDVTLSADAEGEVIGSAFSEATTFPDGWSDELYANEGYCQIFKTASPLMSGTAQATRYRGISNEWQRVWKEKLMEHKMDIEKAMLFGVGKTQTSDPRYSWGIVPYTEQYGKNYNYAWDTSGTASAASNYDTLMSIMEDFYAPETGNSGNKLCLASRSVISYFNKMGSDGFVAGTAGSNPFRVDVEYKDGKFGHKVAQVETVFGGFTMVQEPLFRGPYKDMMVLIDMANVKYRPLVGNGKSRDTYIESNVQSPGMDGRVDQILTEAGLQVQLPETHAIVKFNGNTADVSG